MTVNLFRWERAFAKEISDPDYEEDTEKLDIPIHAFDAIKIGLTATPAPHSLSLFREVTFRYTTDQAIEYGYLVDYEPVKIKSNVRMHGAFLKAGDPVGIIDTKTGEEI